MFQQDDARPRIAAKTIGNYKLGTATISSIIVQITTCFSAANSIPTWTKFAHDDTVKSNERKRRKTQSKDFYAQGIQKLFFRWENNLKTGDDVVERLNGGISLVTVFEELSPVTRLFGHVTRGTGNSASFTRKADLVIRTSHGAHGSAILYIPDQRTVRGCCCMDCSFCSLKTCDSCLAESRNSVPTRIVYTDHE